MLLFLKTCCCSKFLSNICEYYSINSLAKPIQSSDPHQHNLKNFVF